MAASFVATLCETKVHDFYPYYKREGMHLLPFHMKFPQGKSKLLLTFKYTRHMFLLHARTGTNFVFKSGLLIFTLDPLWWLRWKKWVYLIFFIQLSCTSELFPLKQLRDSVLINLFHLCVIRTELNLKMLFSFKLSCHQTSAAVIIAIDRNNNHGISTIVLELKEISKALTLSFRSVFGDEMQSKKSV